MAFAINGIDLLSARIAEERIGSWTADVEADSDKPITGSVTLDLEGEKFVGTVHQGDVEAGSKWKGYVVGGKGGIQKILGAKNYYTPTVKTVLDDLARESGEVLSTEIDPSLLLRRFERYSRIEGPAHTQFRQLADELGVDWRITRAGELWFGAETWLPITAKTIEADYHPEHRMLVVAYDSEEDNDRPVLKPGRTFDDKKIQRTETHVDAGGLRQALFFDLEKGDSGLWATVRRVIRETVWPKLQLARVHGARVTEQAADGTVSVAIDDPAIGGLGKGANRIELVVGLPGTRVRTTSSTRLRFFWDGGRPTKPRAGHFDQGTPAAEINFTVGELFSITGRVTITGDTLITGRLETDGDVVLGSPTATDDVAIAQKIHQSISAMLGAGVGVTGAEAFAAAKAAWDAATLGGPAPPVAPPVMPIPVGATKVKAI